MGIGTTAYFVVIALAMAATTSRKRTFNGGFLRSLRNLLHEFSTAADHCTCLMNSESPPTLVFENEGEKRIIHNSGLYHLLIEESLK